MAMSTMSSTLMRSSPSTRLSPKPSPLPAQHQGAPLPPWLVESLLSHTEKHLKVSCPPCMCGPMLIVVSIVTPASESHLNEPKNNTPGAFPDTPSNEDENYGVNPLPPTEGASNPVSVPAGEKVPPPGEVSSNSIHSAVTTSQGDYEKSGSSIPYIGGALAALGFGGAAVAKKGPLIPESSLPMGDDADKSLDAGPLVNSSGPNATTAEMAGRVPLEENKPSTEVDSAVPEPVKESIAEAHAAPEAAASSEAVQEKSAVEQELLKKVPTSDATGEHAPEIAAGAVGAGAVAVGAAAASVASPSSGVPEQVKESIAEAHAEPEATISTEAVKEKSAMEQELLKKVPEQEETGEPAPTIAAATSATAPAPTTESSSAAPGQATTAAAAVADGAEGIEPTEAVKTTVVPEKTEGDNTEYAPPHAPAAAPGVSGAAAAAVSDGAEDPTLLDEPAVQLGIKNDAEAAGTASEPAAAHDATTADAPRCHRTYYRCTGVEEGDCGRHTGCSH